MLSFPQLKAKERYDRGREENQTTLQRLLGVKAEFRPSSEDLGDSRASQSVADMEHHSQHHNLHHHEHGHQSHIMWLEGDVDPRLPDGKI